MEHEYVKWEISVVDVETDDIKFTKIYCLVVRDTVTLAEQRFVNRKESLASSVAWQDEWLDIEKFPAWAKKRVKVFVWHNGICFDAQVILELLGFKIPVEDQVDTLVISRLLLPQREGGHSLEAWGIKTGVSKSKFEDFSKFSLEMLQYCAQDTLVNVHTLRWLEREREEWGFSDTSVRLEHKVRELIFNQERHGFYLDRTRATKLLTDTKNRLEQVEKEMYKVFVPQPRLDKVITPKPRKAGGFSTVGFIKIIKSLKDMGIAPTEILVGQQIASFSLDDFNLGSTKQVAERLLEIGWKPKNLTPTGLPKIDEESLSPFAKDFPQVGLLSEYLMVRSRNGLAEQWLEAVDDQGYVHGQVNTIGAITRRCTHSNPNMANVPAASDNVPYGKECRGCWTVKDKENYTMVGCDASSLELRMLCHHMKDESYTTTAVSGDIHSLNMEAFRLIPKGYTAAQYKKEFPDKFKELRDLSKRGLYAILYGAGNRKVGSIFGGSQKKGSELKENLFTGIPKFGALVTKMQRQSQTGYVYSLDGGRLWTRSEHSALNTLLQGDGAIVCKLWMCFIHKMARKEGLDFSQLAWIHDEFQFQVLKEHVQRFGEITKIAMKEVEKFFDITCPLDSEWKEGKTWELTH